VICIAKYRYPCSGSVFSGNYDTHLFVSLQEWEERNTKITRQRTCSIETTRSWILDLSTEELEPTATGVAMSSGNVSLTVRELPRLQDMSQLSILSRDMLTDTKDKKSLARPALKKHNLKVTRTKTAGDHIIGSSSHPGIKPTTVNRLTESQQEPENI